MSPALPTVIQRQRITAAISSDLIADPGKAAACRRLLKRFPRQKEACDAADELNADAYGVDLTETQPPLESTSVQAEVSRNCYTLGLGDGNATEGVLGHGPGEASKVETEGVEAAEGSWQAEFERQRKNGGFDEGNGLPVGSKRSASAMNGGLIGGVQPKQTRTCPNNSGLTNCEAVDRMQTLPSVTLQERSSLVDSLPEASAAAGLLPDPAQLLGHMLAPGLYPLREGSRARCWPQPASFTGAGSGLSASAPQSVHQVPKSPTGASTKASDTLNSAPMSCSDWAAEYEALLSSIQPMQEAPQRPISERSSAHAGQPQLSHQQAAGPAQHQSRGISTNSDRVGYGVPVSRTTTERSRFAEEYAALLASVHVAGHGFGPDEGITEGCADRSRAQSAMEFPAGAQSTGPRVQHGWGRGLKLEGLTAVREVPSALRRRELVHVFCEERDSEARTCSRPVAEE